jgi:GNAT superfamily N-acetyltransferase
MPAQIPSVTVAMIDAARQRLGRDDVLIGVADPAEYAEAEALSRAAHPSEMKAVLTADLVAWFIDRNPCGHGFLVLARDAATRGAIGYFLFYPWLLAHRAAGGVDVRPAFLYVHLYVAPAHRRRGVFAAMTRFGLDLVEQLGVGLAYTVPNPRSTPGFLKFGMRQAGTLPFWVRPAVPGWAIAAGVRRDPALSVRQVPLPPADAADVAAMLPASTTAWSPRTTAVMHWRYRERPGCAYQVRQVSRSGQPIAVVVTREMTIKGLRALVVCDAWFSESGPQAMRMAIDDALAGGARVHLAIAFGGGAAPAYAAALRGAGFRVCPPAIQPQPVAIIGGEVGGPGLRVTMPDVRAWHLTPFDWDVF